jgi:hypothetical protein
MEPAQTTMQVMSELSGRRQGTMFTSTWLALAGLGALAADFLILYRGEPWSASVDALFYLLLGAAFLLPIIGGLSALANRSMTQLQRWFCVAIGIAVPAFIVIAVIEILHAVSQMN